MAYSHTRITFMARIFSRSSRTSKAIVDRSPSRCVPRCMSLTWSLACSAVTGGSTIRSRVTRSSPTRAAPSSDTPHAPSTPHLLSSSVGRLRRLPASIVSTPSGTSPPTPSRSCTRASCPSRVRPASTRPRSSCSSSATLVRAAAHDEDAQGSSNAFSRAFSRLLTPSHAFSRLLTHLSLASARLLSHDAFSHLCTPSLTSARLLSPSRRRWQDVPDHALCGRHFLLYL